jgi:hypothetical protein
LFNDIAKNPLISKNQHEICKIMVTNAAIFKTLGPNEAKKVLKGKLSPKIAKMTIGDGIVIEKIFNGIDSGKILITEDGFLTIPSLQKSKYVQHISVKPKGESPRRHYKSCKFLQGVAHRVLYEEKHVPQGCQHCYKVKVDVTNVFALKQLYELSKEIPWDSKCGVDIGSLYSQSIYAGFFYVDGLDQAHEAYHLISKKISQCKDLVSCSRITIKRGCSSYEIKLGASDNWEFNSSSAEIEDEFYSLFKPPKKAFNNKAIYFLNWIKTAFQIGDDSYLKLTNGKRLYPKMMDYSPGICQKPPHEK